MKNELSEEKKAQLRQLAAKFVKGVNPMDESIQNGKCVKIGHIFVMVGRIPDGFQLFHEYLMENMTYMREVDPVTSLSNAERLGLPNSDLALFAAKQAQWFDDDPAHLGIYQRHTTFATKGKSSTQAWQNFKKQFKLFYRPRLKTMEASANLTPDDCTITHIKIPPASHHVNITKIPGHPFVFVTQGGTGVLKIKCKTLTDAGRASLPENSDEIEVTYVCVNPKAEDSQLTPILKKVPPQSADDCFYREFPSKATFELNVGSQYSGLMLYGYCRYSNSRHRDLGIASDWSVQFSIRVP